MAKKKAGVNKSKLIREYKDNHPEAGPKEITVALKAHKVSYGLVSNVLHTAKAKKKTGKKKPAKKLRPLTATDMPTAMPPTS